MNAPEPEPASPASGAESAAKSAEEEPDKAAHTPGKCPGILIFLIFFSILAIILALGTAMGWQLLVKELARPGPTQQAQVFSVSSGTTARLIGQRLEAEGLIRHALLFEIKARLAQAGATLKAGEYAVPARASVNGIFALLSKGKTIQHALTVAEGLTSREILDILRQASFLQGQIEQVPSEGSLLPETWLVTRGTERRAVLDRMQKAMQKLLAEAWGNREPGLPLANPLEALILASIVEKETGLATERPRVAAVFLNRLRRGMRLESDPTIVYGLTGGRPLGRGLRRSEIDRKSAWNTYQIDGLPLTPICNPGREAILAVLHPAQERSLYFVADGSGGHVFASTYGAHLRNVTKWRKLAKKLKRQHKQEQP